jgi:hypothetical protein
MQQQRSSKLCAGWPGCTELLYDGVKQGRGEPQVAEKADVATLG